MVYGMVNEYAATDGTCTDINDCGVDPCGDAAARSCADTGVNEYACTCSDEYTSPATGGICAMIMDCDADELSDCDANADCNHEGPGQHSCTCTEGYSGDGTVNKCDDTDDCANRPCFASADGLYSSTCLDEAAPNTGFTCDTRARIASHGDGRATGGTCTDVNDCGADQCGTAAGRLMC